MGKPLAGAPHAALHFVNHQQPVARVAQGAQFAQVVHVQGIDAAFALDGFHKHGHHIGVALRGGLEGVHIVQGHADKPFHQRPKPGLHLGVARGAQRGNAAAMEGLVEHHHLGSVNALVVAKLARQFERGLVGLQPGGAKKHIRHARERHQLGRQRFLQGHVVVVGGVYELRHLVLQGSYQVRMVVAQGIDRNAAQRVQVFLALGVPDAAALAVGQRNRQAPVGGHYMGRCGGRGRWRCHGQTPKGQAQNKAAQRRLGRCGGF